MRSHENLVYILENKNINEHSILITLVMHDEYFHLPYSLYIWIKHIGYCNIIIVKVNMLLLSLSLFKKHILHCYFYFLKLFILFLLESECYICSASNLSPVRLLVLKDIKQQQHIEVHSCPILNIVWHLSHVCVTSFIMYH